MFARNSDSFESMTLNSIVNETFLNNLGHRAQLDVCSCVPNSVDFVYFFVINKPIKSQIMRSMKNRGSQLPTHLPGKLLLELGRLLVEARRFSLPA